MGSGSCWPPAVRCHFESCARLPIPLPQALFTPIAVDWFARVALGLGETRHPEPPGEGEVGRKGMSHERTFRREWDGQLAGGWDAMACTCAPCSAGFNA